MARLDEIIRGLLGSDTFNLGIGLLSAPAGSTFGESLGHGVQFATQAQQQQMHNQAIRQQLLDLDAQRQAIRSLSGKLPLSPEQATFLQAAPPQQAFQTLGGLLGFGEGQRFQTDIGKLFADLELAERQGNAEAATAIRSSIQSSLGDDVDFDDIRATRNDLIRNSSEFLEQQRGFQSVQAAAAQPSPANDLAMLFGVMKILDPGSIVREGEVELTEGAGSLAQRVAAQFTRVFHGERLTSDQRQDFVNLANQQFEKVVTQQQRLIEDARSFAERHRFRIEDVVPEFVIPMFEPATTPGGSGRIRFLGFE